MTLPFDATSLLQRDGVQIIDAARRADLDAEVPTCPGWDMGDLLWHMSQVWTFWRFIVNQEVTSEEQLADFRHADRVSDGLLFDWAATALNGVHAALTSTPPETEVWTWTGSNQNVWWVRRRMTHEAAVHRWDAEQVVGDAYELWSRVAADGIDEFLNIMAPRNRTEPLGGTLHIHCTDTSAEENGEWMEHELGPGTVNVERAHAKADTAVRGRANDLHLWMWGRTNDDVEILGDEDLAARFLTGNNPA